MNPFLRSSYAFELPKDRIAQTAVHPPESARILRFDRVSGRMDDRVFSELPDMAGADRLFIFNDSRVIPSRVAFSDAEFRNADGFSRRKDGEVFFLKELPENRFEALVYPGAAFSVGSVVRIGNFELSVVAKIPDGRVLEMRSGGTAGDFLKAHGRLPLPPYVEYSEEKERDYQTDFARKDGSLAAPTASLHFTESLISKIREAGSKTRFLTLHVGLGTFKPVKADDIRDHAMHAEAFEVPLSMFRDVAEAKAEGRKIVGVGTTVVRTLESMPYLWPNVRDRFSDGTVIGFWDSLIPADLGDSQVVFGHADASTAYGTTAIFRYPGRTFAVIDEMVTNFHLPESTLFMLLAAFMGLDEAHAAYAHAIAGEYRFYSFGDGMWIR